MPELLHNLYADSLSDRELLAIGGQYGRVHVSVNLPLANRAAGIEAANPWGMVLERYELNIQGVAAGPNIFVQQRGRKGAANDLRLATPLTLVPSMRRDLPLGNDSAPVLGAAIGLQSGSGYGSISILQQVILTAPPGDVRSFTVSTFLDAGEQLGVTTQSFGSGLARLTFFGIEFYTQQARDWFLSRML